MYEVRVKTLDKPYRVSRAIKQQLTGVSPRLLSRMRREAVDCPVKGVVHCKGMPLGEK